MGTLLAQIFAHDVPVYAGVIIVENKGIWPENVGSPDVSIWSHQPLKYKMATIPTLNLMLPPKELFVGVIKQHVAMMSSLTMEFLLFTHDYCLGQWKS